MRRRRQQDISSLDMLLDTMCNTFGGIVFIAILLAVISSSIGRQSAREREDSQESLREMDVEEESARLMRERQDLLTAVAIMERHSTPTHQGGTVSADNVKAVCASNAILREVIATNREETESLAAEVAVLEEQEAASKVSKATLDEQIAALSDELRDERQEVKRPVRLPRLHAVRGMNTVFFAVKDGKFYAVSDVSPGAGRTSGRGFDTQEVNVERGPGQEVVEVRPNAGQVVQPGCEARGKLHQALTTLNSARDMAWFAVYTNSFGAFNYVKSVFVSEGFSFNWTPTEGAMTIVLTDELEAQ